MLASLLLLTLGRLLNRTRRSYLPLLKPLPRLRPKCFLLALLPLPRLLRPRPKCFLLALLPLPRFLRRKLLLPRPALLLLPRPALLRRKPLRLRFALFAIRAPPRLVEGRLPRRVDCCLRRGVEKKQRSLFTILPYPVKRGTHTKTSLGHCTGMCQPRCSFCFKRSLREMRLNGLGRRVIRKPELLAARCR